MKKKFRIWIFPLILGIVLIFIANCKKDDSNKENPPSNNVTDIDGNVYNLVTIGTQIWMVENLKTTKYNDGTAIPNVTDNSAWANLTSPAYCWYHNDKVTYKTPYGALYNWYAVNTEKLCPAGWHVPTNAELTNLIMYLGGPNAAGGKLKEAGIAHWKSPNIGATNESGFTALPGGYRPGDGKFYLNGYDGDWWSSTKYPNDIFAIELFLVSNDSVANMDLCAKVAGLSVRCLKD